MTIHDDTRTDIYIPRVTVARLLRNGHECGGYIVGRHMVARYESAAWYAAANLNGSETPYVDGWTVIAEWSPDEDPDRSWEENAGYDGPGEYECCDVTLMWEGARVGSASLCGIVDADASYRRAVVADLLADAAREAGATVHVETGRGHIVASFPTARR